MQNQLTRWRKSQLLDVQCAGTKSSRITSNEITSLHGKLYTFSMKKTIESFQNIRRQISDYQNYHLISGYIIKKYSLSLHNNSPPEAIFLSTQNQKKEKYVVGSKYICHLFYEIKGTFGMAFE